MTEPTGPDPGRWIRRWGPWLLFAGALVILVVGGWVRRHSLDDAFINYRIVNQLEAGNGPVFNIGERVEAFTSPLWLAILTLGDLILPLRLEWIGMAGGIALGAVGLTFAGIGSRLLHARNDDADNPMLLLPIGAIVAAVFPPIYRLIATGLEDGLTMMWLGGCVWALGRWSRSEGRLGLPSALLIGLGVLVRPDLAPFTALLLGAVLIGDRTAGWRRNVAMVATAAALPVASEVVRMGYFGVLTPNTAIAKSAGLARWGTGWHYLTDTIVPYGFWVPLVVLTLIGFVPLLAPYVAPDRTERGRRSALVAGAFLVASVLSALYIVRVGGDYMQTRLLLPAVFGFLAPVAFVAWPPPWPRRRPEADDTSMHARRIGRIAAAGAIIVWIIVCGAFLRTPSDDRAVLFESRNAVTLPDFQATLPGPIAPDVRPGGVYYMANPLPYPSARGNTPIAIELGVGKVSYALDNDVYVLDGLGLANPIAAHEELRVRGWPGHEKLLTPPWIAALSTAPGSPVRAESFPRPPPVEGNNVTVVLPNQGDAQGRSFNERVDTAREVLECRTMRKFQDSYQKPLTFGRFTSNLTSAWSNQHLVISGEPAIAARTLCTEAERARNAQNATSG